MESKICAKCKVLLPTDNFNYFFEKNRNKWRYASYCKSCHKLNAKKHYSLNKQRSHALTKKWQLENKERHKQNCVNRQKRINESLPDYYVVRLMKARGISEEFIMANSEIIEARRLQVKINRKLKQLKNGTQQIN